MIKELNSKLTLKQTIRIPRPRIYFLFIFSILRFLIIKQKCFLLFLLRSTIYTPNPESELPFLDHLRLQIIRGKYIHFYSYTLSITIETIYWFCQ